LYCLICDFEFYNSLILKAFYFKLAKVRYYTDPTGHGEGGPDLGPGTSFNPGQTGANPSPSEVSPIVSPEPGPLGPGTSQPGITSSNSFSSETGFLGEKPPTRLVVTIKPEGKPTQVFNITIEESKPLFEVIQEMLQKEQLQQNRPTQITMLPAGVIVVITIGLLGVEFISLVDIVVHGLHHQPLHIEAVVPQPIDPLKQPPNPVTPVPPTKKSTGPVGPPPGPPSFPGYPGRAPRR